ncbi:MAG: RNA polymerase factor sigma-54 [Flavobacteriales bacterium]|nr:RNA polymerase factor sigma-54 [Flavobacteriales bacterium]
MLKQNLSQKLQQKLSPQQLLFVKLLELNTLSFEQKLEEELIENPALETGKDDEDNYEYDGETEEFGDSFDDDQESEFDDSEVEAVDKMIEHADLTEYAEDEGDFRLNEDYNPNTEDKSFPVASVVNSFRENLLDQVINALDSERDEKLAEQLIGSFDDDGYLRRELKSVSNDLLFQYNIPATVEELENILKVIQQFDPPGIGARSLQECLLIQINRKEEKGRNPILELAKLVLNECMEDFTKRHFEKIAHKLDVNLEYLKEAVNLITKLNPKPAYIDDERKSDTIIPDFIVVDHFGDLEILINQSNQPDLRINKGFIDTLAEYERHKAKAPTAKEAVQFVKQKIDNAKWFIEAVKQRQNTLLSTMNAIVDIQKEFFKTGDNSKLKPMKLKDIADKIKMDISTISRVATSKYVQTDYGIFLLKEFFSEGITKDDGKEVTTKEVKRILSEYIENEDKNNPMNDDQLTELLKSKGYNMARRTVAKYREQLNIPVARLRKAF